MLFRKFRFITILVFISAITVTLMNCKTSSSKTNNSPGRPSFENTFKPIGGFYPGRVIQYNGKLLIGPNSENSSVIQTDYNLGNAHTITLDADNVTSGSQSFDNNLWENCALGTWPNCTTGSKLEGIDYMYAGCNTTDGSASTSLSGTGCTSAGGTEILFVLGYTKTHGDPDDGGYQSNFSTSDTTSPFVFKRIGQISAAGNRTFRTMSIVIFKGKIYQIQQLSCVMAKMMPVLV